MSFIPLTQEVAATATPDLNSLRDLPIDELINKCINGLTSLIINILIAVVVFYIGKFIIKKIYGLVERIMERRHVDTSLTTFTLSFVKILLYFILLVMVIGILGIETSSFLALFASAGVAIGMALSGTLQNFAGGVLILLLKPYRVGDFIEAQGFSGTVKEIQIFHTIISTPDNKAIIIPNGGLSTGSINNASRESHRRVDWTINLAYGNNVEAAIETIISMLLADERVIKDTIEGMDGNYAPAVVLDQLGRSLVIKARAWTAAGNYWGLYNDFNVKLYKQLPEKGFKFPVPVMNVNLNN